MKKMITISITVIILILSLSACSTKSNETTDISGMYVYDYRGDIAGLCINSDMTCTLQSYDSEEYKENGETKYRRLDTCNGEFSYSGKIEFNSKTNTGYFTWDSYRYNMPMEFSLTDSGNIVLIFDDNKRQQESYSYATYDIYTNLFEKSSHTAVFVKE